MTAILHELDSLVVTITVRTRNADGTAGAPIDLTGATYSAALGPLQGTGAVTGTVTVVSAAGGVVKVAYPALGNFAAGRVVAQLRVTRAGETQTAWEAAFDLKPSIVGA